MFLNHSVRVHLYYGDADCICNRFGDQTVSIVVNYTHKEDLAAAGCQQFVVSGTEYGEIRQFGDFSFLEIYEAGHATLLSIRNHLEMLRRVLL
ncbi:hypothetical protein F5882DRAFT_390019 [Hyaloscypha sp. PMI_1271]|nr:hypothetical protein F5882DRAFT_390019 [Hyaloscypha sp. PMI_1271]